jgi:hypothetical protein
MGQSERKLVFVRMSGFEPRPSLFANNSVWNHWTIVSLCPDRTAAVYLCGLGPWVGFLMHIEFAGFSHVCQFDGWIWVEMGGGGAAAVSVKAWNICTER